MTKNIISDSKSDFIEEPLFQFYNKHPLFLNMHSTSDASFVKLAREGIERKKVDDLISFYAIDLEQISAILGVSSRTLLRKKEDEQLSTHISQQIILLMLLAQKGIEVFQNRTDFNDWMRTPLIALGNEMPIDYLDTSFGVQEIINELGRIEYGVLA